MKNMKLIQINIILISFLYMPFLYAENQRKISFEIYEEVCSSGSCIKTVVNKGDLPLTITAENKTLESGTNTANVEKHGVKYKLIFTQGKYKEEKRWLHKSFASALVEFENPKKELFSEAFTSAPSYVKGSGLTLVLPSSDGKKIKVTFTLN